MLDAIGSNMAARVGSPIQPNASEARVMPNCTAEMKTVGLSSRRSADRAFLLPAAARASRRARRTETRANSDATKYPFAETSRKIATSFSSEIIQTGWLIECCAESDGWAYCQIRP